MGLGIVKLMMVAFLVVSWQLDSKVRSTIAPAGSISYLSVTNCYSVEI